MIQFNLLPDVKLQYAKTQRQKRLVFLSSFVVGSACLSVLILVFFYVFIVQKAQINNLDNSIKENSEKVLAQNDLNKIITVQNQISSLNTLHNNKPDTTRLFTFLQNVTPKKVSGNENLFFYDSRVIDFENNTITLKFKLNNVPDIKSEGFSSIYQVGNYFADTLKFTNYKLAENGLEKRAFSDVVMQQFPQNKANDLSSDFQFTLKFDPAIFQQNNRNITLKLDNEILSQSGFTSRSIIERPSNELSTEKETKL